MQSAEVVRLFATVPAGVAVPVAPVVLVIIPIEGGDEVTPAATGKVIDGVIGKYGDSSGYRTDAV